MSDFSIKKTARSVILYLFLQIGVILAAFSAGYIFGNFFPIENRFSLLNEVIRLTEKYGYYPMPDNQEMQYALIRGFLQAYDDPFTSFYEPPQNELQTNQLAGRFGGIGARIERDSSGKFYLFPFVDSPAKEAGVQDGDILIKVDAFIITQETTIDEVLSAVRGEVGQTVTITISRPPDFQEFSFEIVREEISLPSVSWNLLPEQQDIGYLQVNIIAETTPSEITTAVNDLLNHGAKSIILDLRNNGGGLVQSGVDIAGLFLRKGEILSQQYKGKDVEILGTNQDGPFVDLPLVILVNGGTASAAEIISGSLQALERAKLIGSQTYGKDTIQLVFNLTDGSSLHVTSARWWIPNSPRNEGRWEGLIPDIQVSEEEASQNEAVIPLAVNALREQILSGE